MLFFIEISKQLIFANGYAGIITELFIPTFALLCVQDCYSSIVWFL